MHFCTAWLTMHTAVTKPLGVEAIVMAYCSVSESNMVMLLQLASHSRHFKTDIPKQASSTAIEKLLYKYVICTSGAQSHIRRTVKTAAAYLWQLCNEFVGVEGAMGLQVLPQQHGVVLGVDGTSGVGPLVHELSGAKASKALTHHQDL